jgi:hypothetical protein
MKEINFNRIQIPEDIKEANLAINKQFEEEDVAPLEQEEQYYEEASNLNNLHPSTYIELIVEKDASGAPLSVLEVDLVISREKGKETRKLAMNFAGIDIVKKEMIEKSVSIDRENFEVLKNFFCKLDWNS